MKKNYLICSILALLLPLNPCTARADTSSGPAQKLKDTRQEITEVQSQLEDASAKLWRVQNEMQYKDPKAAELRDEAKKLEKLVLDMRRHLKAKAALNPEIKLAERERNRLFQDLRELKEEERAILHEIGSIHARRAMTE